MASAAQLALVLKASGQSDVQRAFNQVTKSITNIGSAVKAPINAVGSLVDALGRIGLAAQGIQSIASAAAGLGQSLGVGLASQMENVRAQLIAFTKDGAAADAILKQIRTEADKTPFSFQNMAQATVMLQPAAKASGQELMTLIRQAEILAALNPAQGLEGAAFSLREALSGDFISVMERFNIPRTLINQLKAEGVPAMEIVGRALQEMGADYSLVSNLAATTAGRFSTFQDAIDGLKIEAGEIILGSLGKQLDRISAAIEENKEPLMEFARLVGDFMARAIDVGMNALASLLTTLQRFQPFIREIGNTFTAFVHGDFANTMNGLQRLGEMALGALAEQFSAFAPTGERLGNLFGWIGERVQDLTPLIQKFIDSITGAGNVSEDTTSAMDKLAAVVNIVSGAIEGLVEWVKKNDAGMAALVGALIAAAFWYGAVKAAAIAQTIAVTGATVATKAVALAQAALNIVMAANPIVLVVSLIAGLVAALIYAYNANEDFRRAVNDAWAMLRDSVGAAIQFIRDRLNDLAQWWQDQGGTFGGAARAVGEAIVQGIGNALGAGVAFIKQKAGELANSALTAAKEALGIHSPSEETFGIGVDIVEGLANGITRATELAEAAVEEMATAVFGKMEQLQLDHQRRVEDAEREHGRRMAELQEELAGAKKVEDRQRINERILDEQGRFGDKLEDLEIDLQRRREDAARDAEQREIEAQQRRWDVVADFSEKIVDLQSDALERVDDLMQRTAENIQRTIEDVAEKIQDARSKLAADSERLGEDITTRFGREGGSFDTRTARDQEDFDRKQTRLVEDAARDREKIVRDHNDKIADLNQDIERATTDEQRRRVQDRIDEQNREHWQRLTDFDAALRTRQDREKQDFDLRLQRLREDFQKRQAEERADHQTRLSRMAQDVADRISIMQREGSQRIAQLEQEKQEGLLKIAKDIDEKAGLLARDLSKKLGDASTIAMQAAADAVIEGLKKTLDEIRNIGAGAGDSSSGGGSAETLFNAGDTLPSGFQTQSDDNVINDNGEVRVWRDGNLIHHERGGASTILNPGERLANFDIGGVIPGPLGAPRPIMAHGGELVLNPAQQRAQLRSGTDDNRPVVIQIDGQPIYRATWGWLKRNGLTGANLGLS